EGATVAATQGMYVVGEPESQQQGSDGAGAVASPPFVYVPCALDERGELAEVKLVQLDDGRVALMAYTALDRFAAACGEHHPWVVLDTSALEEVRAAKHFDAAYLDVALPVGLRMTEASA